MSATDWKLLQMRRSCNLLSRPEMEGGKTPTTPTVSSIIAAVQCQEAVKLLHGMETLAGRAWVFNGVSGEAYVTEFQRKTECYSHDTLDEIFQAAGGVADTTARDILNEARKKLNDETVQLELAREVLENLVCPKCKQEESMFASLGKVKADAA